MGSYHLSVSTVSRGRGQSAVAGAAYRSGERLLCQREGVLHDYSRKGGIASVAIVAPEGVPAWASDRNALWNAAEAAETRKNSVVAREWRLALPSELALPERVELAQRFGKELVARYGVVADVAVHAPHREGDQRNWHAHVLTTTRSVSAAGFGAKTRVLDVAKTGGAEIEAMREWWAKAQNAAYAHAGISERVDHRSLVAQREEALEQGDEFKAATFERDPEPRLGVAAINIERKAAREAEAAGEEYTPVTDRARAVLAARELRYAFESALVEARRAYSMAREGGSGRLGAALEAIRAVRGGYGGERGPSDAQAASEGDARDVEHGMVAERAQARIEAAEKALAEERDAQVTEAARTAEQDAASVERDDPDAVRERDRPDEVDRGREEDWEMER